MTIQKLTALARLETFLIPHYFTSDSEKKRLIENIHNISGFMQQLKRHITTGNRTTFNTLVIFKLVTFSFSIKDIFFTGSWTAVYQNGLWIHPQTNAISEQEPLAAVLFYQTLSGEGRKILFPPAEAKDIDVETYYIIF